jgi:hypothetical protein
MKILEQSYKTTLQAKCKLKMKLQTYLIKTVAFVARYLYHAHSCTSQTKMKVMVLLGRGKRDEDETNGP